MHRVRRLLSLGCLLALAAAAPAQEASYTRTKDVIYGRKYGLALTMDVFAPKQGNEAAVIAVVSGGWFSRPENVNEGFYREFLKRGYTVFAVVHGSQPKFTIPEILDDMHRAVRFVRHNAKEYKIDPDRIGITGGSAGGHLSLMMGTAGKDGNANAADPVERASSRVRAVACFFPPTDFLNFGEKGRELIDRQLQPPFTAAVDYHEFDRGKARFLPVTDKDKLREITKQVSPLYHVTKDDAPSLIIHGDEDKLVPVQQAELIVAKFKEAGVPTELIVKKGAAHGWSGMDKDLVTFADWFDKHLGKAKNEK